MRRNRLLTWIVVSATAVSLMATPAMATETGNTQDGYTEEIADTDSEEYVSETPESSSEESGAPDASETSDEGGIATLAVDPAGDDGDDQSDEDYSIVTYDVVEDVEEEAPVEVEIVTDSTSDGFHQDKNSGDWYYFSGGKAALDTTDVIKGTVDGVTGWWNVVEGKVTPGETVAKNSSGWWYIDETGMVDKTYTGFASNDKGSWYAEAGRVTKKTNGVFKDKTGAIGTKNSWYYVLGSKVQYDFTGLADYKNASGWWYIKNGKVDRSANTVAKNKNGWWYVTGGKVQKDFTGLANYSNENGWFYITKGKVDRSVNGLAKNKNGWFYLKSGKVDRSYTGFAKNENGYWYMESGKLTRKINSVVKDEKGVIGGVDEWYYVVGSKVQFDFTGLADYSNASGWWYIKDGVVDRSFEGVAKNKNGTYYIKNGKVQKSYNGSVTYNGTTYSVVNGKATAINSAKGVYYSPDDYEFALAESDVIYAGKSTTQLAAPVFTGSQDSNGRMTLTWNSVEGAAKYRVFRKADGDSSWTKLADTTSTSYTDTPPSSKKLYFYTVRCLDSNGNYASDYISGYTGSAVAHYALQFTGNPYVYGGISLTNGCDCSGFVAQVYAHFGVYLYHKSDTQITLGKKVASIADAQPGDIIGRDGHTTLYLGDGWIIHARNEASGVCITSVESTSYSSIRRIY